MPRRSGSRTRLRHATPAQRKAELVARSRWLREALDLEVRLIDTNAAHRARQVAHVVRWARRISGAAAVGLPVVWAWARQRKRKRQHVRDHRGGRVLARTLFMLSTAFRLAPWVLRWTRRQREATVTPQ